MSKGSLNLFKTDFPEQARKLCLLGVIDRDLARYFEVSERTINRWKHKCPEFSEALRRGKAGADAEVAEALYAKAVKGDMTAIGFWLRNRQPDLWRDKRDRSVSPQADTAKDNDKPVTERELAKAVALILKRGVDEAERN